MAIILIVLAIILMLKNSKSATTPDPNETQKKQAKLFYSGFIMFAVGGIAISILSSAPMVSTEISRIYIPVQNVQNFTLNYSNNTYGPSQAVRRILPAHQRHLRELHRSGGALRH